MKAQSEGGCLGEDEMLALADGRCIVVFREPADGGRWFEQRA